LALISQASKALAEAKTLSEVKSVRDKAEAMRQYIRSIELGLEMQNHAAEIKLRAERKAGSMLAQASLCGGDRKSKSHDAILILADLGIDRYQSSRWQAAAAVPDEEFHRYLHAANEAKAELSTAGLLRVARKLGLVRGYARRRDAAALTDPGQLNRGNDSDRSAVSGKAVAVEIIEELKNHLGVVTKILAPICSTGRAELRTAECEHLRRLLADIGRLLDELAPLESIA
jgi:hypothetical protein